MSNVWLTINRATLSACARQPIRECNSIRGFVTQPWKPCRSTNGCFSKSTVHERAIAARYFQLLARRCFTQGVVSSAKNRGQPGNKQRPVTHAKPRRVRETAEEKHRDAQAVQVLGDIDQSSSDDSPDKVEASGPDPRYYSLPDQPYDQAQIDQIFGKDSAIGARQGNYILAILHQRRITGSIAEEGISEPPQGGNWSRPAAAEALQWLRLKHPVDEEATTAQWAEEEARRIESELYTQRGVSLGLFKPTEEETQAAKPTTSPYAGGVLEGMTKAIKKQRAVNEKKREEEQEREEAERLKVQEKLLRERRGQQERQDMAARAPAQRTGGAVKPGESHELQKNHISHEGLEEWGGYKNESQWSRRYRKQAAESAYREPPKMTKLQRLLPSTLVAGFAIACCFLLSTYYTPLPAAYRLFPFLSPAAATCGALIAANLAVAAAWRYPPFWRGLNKFFIMAPGYPFAASIVGNIFSHFSFWHLWPSMIIVGTGGVLVHELLGSRGDFLALYVGAGVFGSWLSLAVRVATGALHTSTLGASGAIAGLLAAGCILAPDHTWNVKLPFADKSVEIWTMVVLPIFILAEVVRLPAKGSTMDHWSHLGGYAAGTVGSLLLERRYTDRARDAERRRREGGIGGNVMWRQDAPTKPDI